MEVEDTGICRTCLNRGEYTIFSPIPSYLHASQNEFLNFKFKNISTLLEETTGLTVTQNDGFPDKMCAICISYLTHAVTYRQTSIESALNYKAGNLIRFENSKISTSTGVCVTEDDLDFNKTRKTDTINYINNILNNPTKFNEYKRKYLTTTNLQQEQNNGAADSNLDFMLLNLLFDKDQSNVTTRNGSTRKPTSSSKQWFNNNHQNNNKDSSTMNWYFGEDFNDDFQNNSSSCEDDMYQEHSRNKQMKSKPTTPAQATSTTKSRETNSNNNNSNIFNYKEKCFEEDDIMDLQILKDANIIINIPEDCKERKCRACYRRFMSDTSYNEHMSDCLELKFLCLIEESNRLLRIRHSRTISPHEFIRRMIFSLKKAYQWLINVDDSFTFIEKNNNNVGYSINSNNDINNEIQNNKDDSKLNMFNKLNNDLEKISIKSEKVNKFQNFNIKKNEKMIINDDNSLLQLLRKKVDNDKKKTFSTSSLLLSSSSSLSNDQNLQLKFNENNNTFFEENDCYKLLPNNYCDNIRTTLLTTNQTTSLTTTMTTTTTNKTSTINNDFHHNNFANILTNNNNNNTSSSSSCIKMNFSAHCNACDTIFNSIDSLERHNLKYHNNSMNLNINSNLNTIKSDDNNDHQNNIINLFEDNTSNDIEGTVDLMNILSLEKFK